MNLWQYNRNILFQRSEIGRFKSNIQQDRRTQNHILNLTCIAHHVFPRKAFVRRVLQNEFKNIILVKVPRQKRKINELFSKCLYSHHQSIVNV